MALALLCARAWAASDVATLTGRDIYQRVLDNRFASFIQDTTLVSADRGGRSQTSQLRMIWRDFSAGETGPLLSKALVKYTHPFDIRYAGYPIIQTRDDANEQFVYLPQRRKITRVHLRGQSIFGTDFSYEDIIPRELQDASYERVGDEILDGRAVLSSRRTPLPARIRSTAACGSTSTSGAISRCAPATGIAPRSGSPHAGRRRHRWR